MSWYRLFFFTHTIASILGKRFKPRGRPNQRIRDKRSDQPIKRRPGFAGVSFFFSGRKKDPFSKRVFDDDAGHATKQAKGVQ
jgi:hypothetical protein